MRSCQRWTRSRCAGNSLQTHPHVPRERRLFPRGRLYIYRALRSQLTCRLRQAAPRAPGLALCRRRWGGRQWSDSARCCSARGSQHCASSAGLRLHYAEGTATHSSRSAHPRQRCLLSDARSGRLASYWHLLACSNAGPVGGLASTPPPPLPHVTSPACLHCFRLPKAAESSALSLPTCTCNDAF